MTRQAASPSTRQSCSRRARCTSPVLRGPMGFGHTSRLHTTKVLRLSQDPPLVIEIMDSEDKIDLVAAIEPMMGSALVTTEKVKVIRYGESGPSDMT